MDDQQLPDPPRGALPWPDATTPTAPSPAGPSAPPAWTPPIAAPAADPFAAAPAGEPAVTVALPSGPPSVWSAGSGGGQVPPGWSQADPTYLAAPSAPARRPRRIAAIGASLALVVGGLATTAVVLNQRPAAQPTAEAAVLRFLGAVEDGDLLGAAESLSEGERSLVVDLLADWRDSGVDGVPTDGDLRGFDAYTLTLDDLQTVTQPVTDRIAVVELTGGRYTVSADATKLPFGIGDFAAQVAADADDDGRPDTTTTTSGDIAESADPPRLAAVREDDGWHVSLFYTVAEAARLDAGLQAPDPARRIADKGAATPEDAVREMVEAGARGDWTRMIELLSPSELGVLHDYGHLLLDDAPPPPAEPWFTVDELTFDRRSARNATMLTVKTMAGSATVDGRTATMRLEQLSPGCFHVQLEADGEEPIDSRGCAEDGFGQEDNTDWSPAMREQIARLQAMGDDIGGIATVEIGGLWYVSPVRTLGRMVPAAVLGFQLVGTALQDAGGPQGAFGGRFGGSGGLDEMDPSDPDACFGTGSDACEDAPPAD